MLAVFHLHRDRRTLGTYVLDYDDKRLSCCIHHFFFPAAHKSNIAASQGTKDKTLKLLNHQSHYFCGDGSKSSGKNPYVRDFWGFRGVNEPEATVDAVIPPRIYLS
jgi:hypothetical protein